MAYPTVLDDLVPAYEPGFDYIMDFDSRTFVDGTPTGRTATMEDDGTFTLSGTPVAGEYLIVKVFDYSTGLEHVMSPYKAFMDGTIELIGGEIVPYLIGSEGYLAEIQLTSVHLVGSATGSTGTVVSQSPSHMSRVVRGTTVSYTLGGTPNYSRNSRRQGLRSFNSVAQ